MIADFTQMEYLAKTSEIIMKQINRINYITCKKQYCCTLNYTTTVWHTKYQKGF